MKTRMHLSVLLLAIVFIGHNLYGQTDQLAFDWDQYNKQATSLSNLQFSPDGKYILYSTRKADFGTNNWVRKNRLMNLLTKEDAVLEFEQKGVRKIK